LFEKSSPISRIFEIFSYGEDIFSFHGIKMKKSNLLFGTVGSPKSTPKKPGGSVGAIYQLRSLGLDSFELGWVRSVRVSESTCMDIKSVAQELNIVLSVHAPYFINLNADDEEWPKSRKRLMDAAHYGYLAGATDIVFHPGSYFGREPEDVLPVAISRLQTCVKELREKNNIVTLRPETMGKSAMLGSLQDVLAISAEIDGVEPCMDFPHLFARSGDGSMNTYVEWKDCLLEYGSSLGEASLQRLHIHLSGIEFGPKGEKKHLCIEESELDINAVLSALRDMNCSGRILCESPILEEDALLIQKKWNKLIKNEKA
jgi:deoxyribonuclease-4